MNINSSLHARSSADSAMPPIVWWRMFLTSPSMGLRITVLRAEGEVALHEDSEIVEESEEGYLAVEPNAQPAYKTQPVESDVAADFEKKKVSDELDRILGGDGSDVERNLAKLTDPKEIHKIIKLDFGYQEPEELSEKSERVDSVVVQDTA